jgi:hypothetical protein
VVRELSKLSGGGDPGIGPTFVWLIGTPHATNQLDAIFDQLFAAVVVMRPLRNALKADEQDKDSRRKLAAEGKKQSRSCSDTLRSLWTCAAQVGNAGTASGT